MRTCFAKFFSAGAVLAASGIASAASDSASPVVYEVSFIGEPRQEIRVQVDLRGIGDGSPLYIHSRAAQVQSRNQISDISCDDAPLRLDEKGVAAIPDNCPVVSWKSRMEVIGKDGLLVEQQSFISANGERGLLSGPASLLRFAPAGPSPQLNLLGSDGSVLYQRVLPPETRAPFFLPFGNWATGQAELESFDIVYHVDDISFFESAEPWPEHLSGLRYFAEVLRLERRDQPLHVVWIGRNDPGNNINGAAGDSVLLVNYTRGSGRLKARDRTRALFVLLHEQYHQISPEISPCENPGGKWRGESVATYYALKALRRQIGDIGSFREIWAEFVGVDRPIDHTFTDIERQLASGDGSNSFLFYSQGAAFWSEFDELIMAKTEGAESLDDYIGEFQRVCLGKDGSFPRSVIATLPVGVTDEAILLFEKYIGQAPRPR